MRITTGPFALWITTASAKSLGWSSRSSRTGSHSAAFRHSLLGSRGGTKLRMSTSTADSSSLRVALCQFHVTQDKAENHKVAQDFLKKAKEKGAQLAVLPEIWNSPYATAAFPEYAESLPSIGDVNGPDTSSRILMEAAKEMKMWIVGGSIPERVMENGQEKIYNTCLVLNPEGKVVAKHRKVHLFDIDVPGGITFFESETLSPGETVSHFNTPFGEIGVGICYDIRFAEYAMLLSQQHNCVVLIYPGAFNMTTGPAHWELLQRGRALDNQCYVITASPARTAEPAASNSKYPHYTAWGHSTVVSPWGEVVGTTDEKEDLVIVDLDLSKVDETRRSIPIGKQKRLDMYSLEQAAKIQ